LPFIELDENKTKNLLQKIYIYQNFYSDRILNKLCNKRELGLTLMFGSVVLMAIIPSSSVVGIAWGQTTTTPLVSTRDHFNLTTGKLLPGHNLKDYDPSDNIPGLDR
jgi:hypothetical protein